ncbi:hypothetical protein [Nonomuraea sp. NPDC050643]|uniref:hypothetical protein n=1 Tax=Nonomuraea sp. NPDC050643 TaxID=3155660 RepID=UPI0033D5A918
MGAHRSPSPADRPGAGPPVGLARIASLALAGVTHFLAPAFLLLGVYLLTRWTLFLVLLALVALDLAWLLRPRSIPSRRAPSVSPVTTRPACSPCSTGSAPRSGRPGPTWWPSAAR